MGRCNLHLANFDQKAYVANMMSTGKTSSAEMYANSDVKVMWVHNTPGGMQTFLTDIMGALSQRISLYEFVFPLRPSMRSLIRALVQMRAIAKHADIVHAQFGSLIGFMASFSGRPFILTLRGTDFYRLPSSTLIGRVDSAIRQGLTYIACLRSDVVIVMSENMRKGLRRWPFMKNRLILVVPDPIGEDFWRFRGTAYDAGPNPLAQLKILIGSLVANNPVKRAWLVERAVAICQKVGIPVSLTVLSGLPRSEVPVLMAQADIVALTSTHEGWPNIIKEGIALGLPFLATDVSDLKSFSVADDRNYIIEPCELDISLKIIDIFMRKAFNEPLSQWIPETVSIKHLSIYNHCAEVA